MFNLPYNPETAKTFQKQNETPLLKELQARKYYANIGIDTTAVYKLATDTIRTATICRVEEQELKEAFQILKDLGTETINTKWLNFGYPIKNKTENKKIMSFIKECEQKGLVQQENNKTTYKNYKITA